LVQVKKYPSALIAMEKMIMLGELKKRFDILVYDTNHVPWMMIECKAPLVKLDESVLHQLLRYHISIPTGFLIITNGDFSYGWQKKEQDLHLIRELPEWIK
ncbi:MAG: type I restriction enzyme HsdR N-terminal domain-containing protein, partial [Chitinophagaceae bacterium]